MTITEQIHQLFDIKEAHELPSRMMAVLFSSSLLAEKIVAYKNLFPDLHHDFLRDYFQQAQAERSVLKQDYTPESLCKLMAQMVDKAERIADLCAGTGSLTLAAWNLYPESEFVLYEVSSASMPFLLFNLAVRNVHATVVHGDLLTEEVQHVYRIEDHQVIEVQSVPEVGFDTIISNPPYSLKWSGDHDLRFGSYPSPPKSKADYCFILIAMSMLHEGGRGLFILPHGPLFRGAAEGEIRKMILEDHQIRSIIGLPPALFDSTQIPVIIMEVQKHDDDLLVIDASGEMEKHPKQNIMQDGHIKRVLSAWTLRETIKRFCSMVSYGQIEDNDFNLNIPRYVDTYIPEEIPPLSDTCAQLIENRKEIRDLEAKIMEQFEQLEADPRIEDDWKFFIEKFREYISL